MNRIFASISGGKTSAYMARILQETMGQTCDIRYVFANTGFEHEETLVFLDKLDKELDLNLIWLEAKFNRDGKGTQFTQVDFETASRWENWRDQANPFEVMTRKYGVPHRGRPHCTRELKLAPMYSYINSLWPDKNYQVAIGIRADEAHRKSKNAWQEKLIYPLINLRVDKQEVNDFWEDHDYTLNIPESHGNCLGCFKKSFSKLGEVHKSNPEAFEFTDYLENQQVAKRIVRSASDPSGDLSPQGIQKMYGGWRNTKELIALIQENDGAKIAVPDVDAPGSCTEECGITGQIDLFADLAA